MTVYLSHRAIAATVKKDDAPYNGAGVSCVDEPIMTTKDVVRAELPPVFFKNDFGVVTNRRQFKEFYSYELASGRNGENLWVCHSLRPPNCSGLVGGPSWPI
jgi:hypothetical protein